jgi:hypothetical protein
MHWCADETMALMASIPFLGYALRRLHAWWHRLWCPHETTLQRAQRLLGRGESIQVSEEEFDRLQAAFEAPLTDDQKLRLANLRQGFCPPHGIRIKDCPVCAPVVEALEKHL